MAQLSLWWPSQYFLHDGVHTCTTSVLSPHPSPTGLIYFPMAKLSIFGTNGCAIGTQLLGAT